MLIDEEFKDIEKDMYLESEKYGKVISIKIPRPHKENDFPVGTGNVYIEFANVNTARMARRVILLGSYQKTL